MQRYCERCSVPFDGERCPVCGKKSARFAAPEDICFLTEKEQLWGGMLADVLRQENIPFIRKSVMGAGMALKAGPMLERVRFYVYYKQLTEAADIVEGLFSAADGGSEPPEEEGE